MNLLKNILASKKEWLAHQQKTLPTSKLESQLGDISLEKAPIFASTLKQRVDGQKNALIAEFKRASPSQGDLGKTLHEVCEVYRKKQVTCISVLTDQPYFKGCFEDIKQFRLKTKQLILCKDFIIDPYQLFLAKAYGADCVLLIADILPNNQLKTLYQLATQLKMDVLIELFDQTHLPNILNLEPKMVGINSRNLANLSVNLENITNVVKQIPKPIITIAESGIQSHKEVEHLNQHGIYAFLMGHTFLISANISKKINKLFPQGF